MPGPCPAAGPASAAGLRVARSFQPESATRTPRPNGHMGLTPAGEAGARAHRSRAQTGGDGLADPPTQRPGGRDLTLPGRRARRGPAVGPMYRIVPGHARLPRGQPEALFALSQAATVSSFTAANSWASFCAFGSTTLWSPTIPVPLFGQVMKVRSLAAQVVELPCHVDEREVLVHGHRVGDRGDERGQGGNVGHRPRAHGLVQIALRNSCW